MHAPDRNLWRIYQACILVQQLPVKARGAFQEERSDGKPQDPLVRVEKSRQLCGLRVGRVLLLQRSYSLLRRELEAADNTGQRLVVERCGRHRGRPPGAQRVPRLLDAGTVRDRV